MRTKIANNIIKCTCGGGVLLLTIDTKGCYRLNCDTCGKESTQRVQLVDPNFNSNIRIVQD